MLHPAALLGELPDPMDCGRHVHCIRRRACSPRPLNSSEHPRGRGTGRDLPIERSRVRRHRSGPSDLPTRRTGPSRSAAVASPGRGPLSRLPCWASTEPATRPSSPFTQSHSIQTFGTLAFCRRWLERPDGGSATVNGSSGRQTNYLAALRNLCDVGLVQVDGTFFFPFPFLFPFSFLFLFFDSFPLYSPNHRPSD